MEYHELLNKDLAKPTRCCRTELVLDLFAGCGGLALGFEAAGFETTGFEKLGDACETYNKNLLGECRAFLLEPGQDLVSRADVIIGGPPCQPFSVNGHQNGRKDARDGFPAFLSAVDRYRPAVVLIENVRGMLYQNRSYFAQIRKSLARLGYLVEWKLLNAVDFGVPQKRERLFVVAHKAEWHFPEPSAGAAPFTAGDALAELAFQTPPGSKFLTKSMDEYVAKYEKASFCIRPRDLHLDQPSRTVTCRNLNGATGDMLRIALPDGRRKRLSVREGARLQSFPDWFEFCGTEGSQFNQVGNAVPPLLANALAKSVIECLDSDVHLTTAQIEQRVAVEQTSFDFAE